jgi:hypothetical protein
MPWGLRGSRQICTTGAAQKKRTLDGIHIEVVTIENARLQQRGADNAAKKAKVDKAELLEVGRVKAKAQEAQRLVRRRKQHLDRRGTSPRDLPRPSKRRTLTGRGCTPKVDELEKGWVRDVVLGTVVLCDGTEERAGGLPPGVARSPKAEVVR